MCIRDSPDTEVLNVARTFREKQIPLDVIYLDIHYMDAYKICLLYTSDAADERSSVDLGGRRIIKKKNNTDSGCILVRR